MERLPVRHDLLITSAAMLCPALHGPEFRKAAGPVFWVNAAPRSREL